MANRAKFLDFLDMIDGGGAGQMGGEFQGGGILSEIANMIATPYGSEDPRRRARRRKALGLLDKIGTPEEQAAAASRAAATPSVVTKSAPRLRPQLRPDNFMTEAQKEQVVMNQPVGQGYPNMTMPAIAGYTTPKPAGADYPNMTMPAIAGYTTPFTAQMTQPSALSGGTVQPMPSSSIGSNTGAAVLTFGGGEVMPQPNMPNPAAFSANPPSAAAMTSATPAPADRNPRLAAFNAAMATVPQMLQGTEIAGMYRDHLLNGGSGTFAQFTGAQ